MSPSNVLNEIERAYCNLSVAPPERNTKGVDLNLKFYKGELGSKYSIADHAITMR